jgi:hypothetical protein
MLGAIMRAFWGDFNDPTTYAADPYGAVVNQLGHIALGCAAVVAICAFWALVYGEMPYRWAVGFVVVFLYAVIVEFWWQRWFGADSTIDTAFVAMGASAPLVSLHEVTYRPEIRLEHYPVNMLVWLACTALALALYVWPRARRAYGGEK